MIYSEIEEIAEDLKRYIDWVGKDIIERLSEFGRELIWESVQNWYCFTVYNTAHRVNIVCCILL